GPPRAALAGHVEADPGDALDLARGVGHRVDRARAAVREALDAPGLAEVEAARQLADDHEIGPLDHLPLERRGVDEHRETLGRTEVRVEVELLADRQETPLGPLLVGHVVPLGAADGAEEDRVRATAELERAGGQRRARRVDRGAAHEAALELEPGARALADG